MAVAVAAPKASDDEQLLRRYHESGDLDAREELVVRLMPLARQLASRYRHSGEPLEDLTQVACVGLLKAIDRYDPERGTGLTRYALPTMLGELKRHFRDKGWALRVPRPRDVAEAIGVSVEDVLEAMEAATAYEATSLDAPRGSSDDDEEWTHGGALGDEDAGYELVELNDALRGTLDALPPRERLILRLRFERDLTQAEIANCVGVSQMHVSRLLRRSLDRLSAAGAST